MADFRGSEGGGLFAALKNIASNVLDTGRARLDLLANEIEVEKIRAVRLFFLAQTVAFCFYAGILFAMALLVAAFWEQRVQLLGLLVVFCFAAGAGCLVWLKASVRRSEKMFSATIAELEEDVRQLKAVVGHHEPSA
jgi:uncharacterized membrane protein YqjE